MNSLTVVDLAPNYFDEILSIKSQFISKLTKDDLIKMIDDKLHNIFVLLENQRFIGYIECLTIVPEAEIYSIAVRQEQRHKGYATFLLNWFKTYMKDLGCITIYLEVNKINSSAIALYKRNGFVEYGERKNYYGENDAILMKCDL